MGVDFFPCDECGESICDCGPYWRCDDCWHKLCVDCQKELGAIKIYYEDYRADEDIPDNKCPFCSRESATDSQLLEFTLKILNLTKEELLKKYQEEK